VDKMAGRKVSGGTKVKAAKKSKATASSDDDKEPVSVPLVDMTGWSKEREARAMKLLEQASDEADTPEDCFEEGEEETGWMMFIEEKMEFPFRARTPILKSDGTEMTRDLDVIGFARAPTSVLVEWIRPNEPKLFVHVDYNGVLMMYDFFDLKPIDASDDTLLALQIWQWNHETMDEPYVINVPASED
jgi:Calcium binding